MPTLNRNTDTTKPQRKRFRDLPDGIEPKYYRVFGEPFFPYSNGRKSEQNKSDGGNYN